MTDIVKGVLSGSWAVLVGWILPVAVGLAFFGLTVLPSVRGVPLFASIANASANGKTLWLLVGAVIIGLTLSSLSTPLYRILEGYTFWPRAAQENRIKAHKAKRTALRDKVARGTDPSEAPKLSDALALEGFHRYPDNESQIAPTMLGNAIRRFEYYSFDRYQMDSQLLWSQLRGVVDESVTKEVDNSRSGVDFFVCFVYVSFGVAATGLLALLSGSPRYLSLLIAVLLGAITVFAAYRAAIKATDAWASAVRAMVDLGRVPLAKALGLAFPATIEEERDMWLKVGWILGFAYDPQGGPLLDDFRVDASPKGDQQDDSGGADSLPMDQAPGGDPRGS